MSEGPKPFWRARAYDLATASPLVLLCLAGARDCVLRIWGLAAPPGRIVGVVAALEIVKNAALLLFLVQQVALISVRWLPSRRAKGIMPRLAAVIGAYLGVLFFRLPPAPLSMAGSIASISLIVLGTLGAVYSLSYLGRCYAVLPQARGLVTTGPYGFVRHPLYVAEQIASLGVMLQFARPWSLIIAAASILAQFPRMHYEEKVLSEAYPAYQDYARRTARLVPGIY
jgi:protein-S-isoprenylcysteine O-methyltransferase Ste14